MTKIIHTSTGASNSPRELIVTPKIVGVPTGGLYLWTDENDYIEHTRFSGRIASVLNQVADPSPNVDRLICSGYDRSGKGGEYPTVDDTQFDGINCLKFIAPSGSGGRTRLYLDRDSSYSDPYTGTTTSGLIKIVGRREIPLPGWRTAGVTFYFPSVANGQWRCQTGAYSFIDVGNPGDVPDPVNEWHLFTTVYQTTPTHIARLYIDGEKVFDVSFSSPPYSITQHYGTYILNRSTNPIDGIFTGYVAHTAAWVRPLSDSEVLRYWGVIKNKYGL